MKEHRKVAVIGGTGKSGSYLVKHLLKRGYRIKLLVRNPSAINVPDERIEIMQGNVEERRSIQELLREADAVISTLGLGNPPSEPTIFCRSTLNILRVMKEYGLKRYILTTGLNVDTPFDRKGEETARATEWMRSTYPVSTDSKQEEYRILSRSEADWTVVRLPIIRLNDQYSPIITSLEDCPGNHINAGDLSGFLIKQLSEREFIQKAPFIANAV
ncbi:putative NAD(P)-binding protein [Anseongella ginsenosidimutans]|uniref:Putative NAD(P)-binding protein n=2 Tax=Anseongella ginsenosidimutans TaxID=496056 RepID=A0A4R3KV36_9SPHI|nr:putative NAD(P)-binding protein [Anseongella ginsenosidimutans]